MLTDTNLRSAVDALWDKLWSGGLSNPLDAIEQLSFVLFLKRLDERRSRTTSAQRGGEAGNSHPLFPKRNCAGRTGPNCPPVRRSRP